MSTDRENGEKTMTMIELPSRLMQSEITFSLDHQEDIITNNIDKEVAISTIKDQIELNIGVEIFADAIWVIVGEKKENCAPGIIMRYASQVQLDDSPAPYLYNSNDLPSVECEVLLGTRDDPLTNMLASRIIQELLRHATVHYSNQRQILMCLNIAQCANKLHNTQQKKRYLTCVCDELLRLLKLQQE